MKVSELEGAKLDYWVAKAENFPMVRIVREEDEEPRCILGPAVMERFEWSPSESWEQGGPIIGREHVGTEWDGVAQRWHAQLVHAARADGVQLSTGTGPSALIAAMRAYVASKFGDTVPDLQSKQT